MVSPRSEELMRHLNALNRYGSSDEVAQFLINEQSLGIVGDDGGTASPVVQYLLSHIDVRDDICLVRPSARNSKMHLQFTKGDETQELQLSDAVINFIKAFDSGSYPELTMAPLKNALKG